MQSVPDRQFDHAVSAWQSGRLQEARRYCDDVLRRHPHHVDALRLSGTLYYREAKYDLAVLHLREAAARHASPDTLNALALSLKCLGDIHGAEIEFKRCLSMFPDNQEALTNYGLMLVAEKRYEVAIAQLEKALIKAPNDKRLLANLVVAHQHLGHAASAARLFESLAATIFKNAAELENAGIYFTLLKTFKYAEILLIQLAELNPQKTSLLHQLGNAAMQSGDYPSATSVYEKLLQLDPRDVFALNNLALAFNGLARTDQAIALLERAISIDPNFIDAISNMASILSDTGKHENAIEYCRRALNINPRHINAMINLGKSLTLVNKLEEAESILKQAIDLEPKNYLANANLGNVYNRQGRFQESIETYRHALEIAQANHLGAGNIADTLFNIGLGYGRMGEMGAAEQYYASSVKLDDSNKDCIFNLGISELTQGRFDTAWRHYFYRPRYLHPQVVLSPIEPGMSLAGKKILLVAGQGLGDELLFMRFARELRSRCAHITYLADMKLAEVATGAPGIDHVVTATPGLSNFDLVFSMDDLPLLLNIDSANKIPPPVKLIAPRQHADAAQEFLRRHGPPPYLATTWRAGLRESKRGANYQALFKQITLESMVEIFNSLTCTVVCLQRNPEPNELEIFSRLSTNPVALAHGYNDDLSAMLGLLSHVDEYVTVSNTNVHLCASTNGKARILVPFPPEWRWLDQGKFSPWYTDFPTYRQAPNGDWTTAFSELKSDLEMAWKPSGAALTRS